MVIGGGVAHCLTLVGTGACGAGVEVDGVCETTAPESQLANANKVVIVLTTMKAFFMKTSSGTGYCSSHNSNAEVLLRQEVHCVDFAK
jgi:hypothetical protein